MQSRRSGKPRNPAARVPAARVPAARILAARILAVDSDPKLLRLLRLSTEAAGFKMVCAMNVREGVRAVAVKTPDLLLVGAELPDGSGISLCEQVREFSDVPIIILSAHSKERDVLAGFDAGCDDYVAKPFSPAELIARAKALLKRTGTNKTSGLCQLVAKDIRIDFVRRRVFKAGSEVRLTNIEYHLLLELAKNAGKVMLHGELLGRVWGAEYTGELEYLRAYICHLRRKLEDTPSSPELIVSIPGIGYSFASEGGDLWGSND